MSTSIVHTQFRTLDLRFLICTFGVPWGPFKNIPKWGNGTTTKGPVPIYTTSPTFSLRQGTPLGGGVTGYGLDDVIAAEAVFGDAVAEELTEFEMEVGANGSVNSLTYRFASIFTPTPTNIIVMNFPFMVFGTDTASREAFSYTYANSTPVMSSVLPDPRQPTLRFKGKKKIRTTRSRYTLRGTAYDPDGDLAGVLLKDKRPRGPKKYRAATGLAKWRYRARLKSGRNRITAYAIDATDLKSSIQKAIVIRR